MTMACVLPLFTLSCLMLQPLAAACVLEQADLQCWVDRHFASLKCDSAITRHKQTPHLLLSLGLDYILLAYLQRST